MVFRSGRIAAGVSLGLLMGLTGFSSAEAASANPPSPGGFQHFLDCFGAMVHDGAAHQQYCSPGSNVPSNSSLGSFSGGAVVCNVTSLDRPLFGRDDVASLGDWTDAAPSEAVPSKLIVADVDPCYVPPHGCGSIKPLFAPFMTASLDPEIGFPTVPTLRATGTLVTAC